MVSLYLNQNNTYYTIDNVVNSLGGKKYEVGERINAGGNAVVHKCQDLLSGEEYAIKLQLNVLGRFASKRESRFQIEIEVLKQIHHRQLTEYIDDGKVQATYKIRGKPYEVPIHYVVMPLADTNLMEYLKDKNKSKVPYESYISQFKGLAQALAEVQKKAIHRDIKPENILISGETWLLSDFGLCKFNEGVEGVDLTGLNEQVGPRYWPSPEGVNRMMGCDDEICKQSDVFQLCSIFWYVINGRYPAGVITKDDWTGPENLFEVIYKSLAHDLRNRPADADTLYELLKEASESA